MAACDLVGDKRSNGGDIIEGESPPTMTSTGSNNNERCSAVDGGGKMLRKRMASEIEVPPQQLYGEYYPRFTRRINNNPSSSLSSSSSSSMAFNHSTSISVNNMNMMFSNSNPSTNLTSGCSGFLSNVTSSTRPTLTTTNLEKVDSFCPNNPQPPAVCGFSGLPLFPPVSNQNTGVTGTVTTPAMEDGSPTAWIDGIIKDLIHNSANVSIPQLIHNVREIIHPCNPNLAALIEYRLHSLMADSMVMERKKEASLPVHVLQQRQYQQHQQQQGSSRLSLNLDAGGLDNLLNYSLAADASALNWGLTQLPPPPVTQANPPPIHDPQPQPQPQSQPQPQPEKDNVSPQETVAATTTSPSPAPAPATTASIIREKKEELRQQKRDEEGLHLLTLLLECAEAVSADNFEEANKMLLEISELSTPYGTSAQRVAAYFSEAMSARLVSSCLGIYAALPSLPQTHTQKMVSAFQVFNGISPFVKFSHFTANQAIQEAFEREDRVHIIDLDIMQGLQWPGLFHILASRPGGPPYVRLTGLGTNMEALEATGKRLSDFAEKLGLPFEFNPVAEKVGNLDPEKLHVSKREATAVHWLQHSLYDVTGSDTNTLWLLQRYAAVFFFFSTAVDFLSEHRHVLHQVL